MSLAKPEANDLSTKQKIAIAFGILGLFILVLALANTSFPNKGFFLAIALGLISVGTILFANEAYLTKLKGVKNDSIWFYTKSPWDNGSYSSIIPKMTVPTKLKVVKKL